MRNLSWKLVALLSAALLPLGCSDTSTTGTTRTTERTTTTTTRETAPVPATTPSGNVDLDRRSNGRNAADRTAANNRDAVDVDITPGGGVDVDVRGEPIRDRIRERRAARDTGVPR